MKMMRDRTSPRYLFDKKYKVSLLTTEDWKVGRAHLPGDGDNWFADGSKNREGARAGFFGKNSHTSLVFRLDQPRLRPYSNVHTWHRTMAAAGISASAQIVERPS